jgi:hypothetical protein
MGSPIPPAPSAASLLSGEVPDDPLHTIFYFAHQDGSKIRPNLTMVDTDYPERNGPMFDIEKLQEVEHKNYFHTAYHIRMSIPLPDYLWWEAFIPDPREFPSLLKLYGRIIMLRGPSRAFWLRDAARYHKDTEKIDCPKTKQRHEKIDTAIENDPSRKYSYHLLVFPQGVVLVRSSQTTTRKLLDTNLLTSWRQMTWKTSSGR